MNCEECKSAITSDYKQVAVMNDIGKMIPVCNGECEKAYVDKLPKCHNCPTLLLKGHTEMEIGEGEKKKCMKFCGDECADKWGAAYDEQILPRCGQCGVLMRGDYSCIVVGEGKKKKEVDVCSDKCGEEVAEGQRPMCAQCGERVPKQWLLVLPEGSEEKKVACSKKCADIISPPGPGEEQFPFCSLCSKRCPPTYESLGTQDDGKLTFCDRGCMIMYEEINPKRSAEEDALLATQEIDCGGGDDDAELEAEEMTAPA